MFDRRKFRRALSSVGVLLFACSTLAVLAQGPSGTLLESAPVTLTGAQETPERRRLLEAVEVRAITYLSDGLRVKGFIALPRQGERLPCVIFNRGGNLDFGALTPERAVDQLGRLASWGYVVVASQYRGNAGGEGREEFGGRDVNDVLNLLPLLDALPRADARRVGMWGRSRGGLMAYLALTRTDRIQAAVIDAGMSDSFGTIEARAEMEAEVYSKLIPDYANRREAALLERSPIRWPEKISRSTPVLLLHGTADWRVDPRQTLAMAARFFELRQPFRLVLFEGGDHALTEHREEADRVIRNWFDVYVRDRKPWPSLVPHGR